MRIIFSGSLWGFSCEDHLTRMIPKSQDNHWGRPPEIFSSTYTTARSSSRFDMVSSGMGFHYVNTLPSPSIYIVGLSWSDLPRICSRGRPTTVVAPRFVRFCDVNDNNNNKKHQHEEHIIACKNREAKAMPNISQHGNIGEKGSHTQVGRGGEAGDNATKH